MDMGVFCKLWTVMYCVKGNSFQCSKESRGPSLGLLWTTESLHSVLAPQCPSTSCNSLLSLKVLWAPVGPASLPAPESFPFTSMTIQVQKQLPRSHVSPPPGHGDCSKVGHLAQDRSVRICPQNIPMPRLFKWKLRKKAKICRWQWKL